jgi:hypothetical protein
MASAAYDALVGLLPLSRGDRLQPAYPGLDVLTDDDDWQQHELQERLRHPRHDDDLVASLIRRGAG